MAAPETTASELSTMVPASVPRSDCATAVNADAASRVAIATHFRTEFSQRMVAPIPYDYSHFRESPHTVAPLPDPTCRIEEGQAIQPPALFTATCAATITPLAWWEFMKRIPPCLPYGCMVFFLYFGIAG